MFRLKTAVPVVFRTAHCFADANFLSTPRRLRGSKIDKIDTTQQQKKTGNGQQTIESFAVWQYADQNPDRLLKWISFKGCK